LDTSRQSRKHSQWSQCLDRTSSRAQDKTNQRANCSTEDEIAEHELPFLISKEEEVEIRNQDNISDALRSIGSGLEGPLFSISSADSTTSLKAPEFLAIIYRQPVNRQHGCAVAMEEKCRLDERANVETAGLDQIEL
jgi:hypothetical protein